MSKTKKIKRLSAEIVRLKNANASLKYATNMPWNQAFVVHQPIPRPNFEGFGARDMEKLIDYIYNQMDVEYQKFCDNEALGSGKKLEDITFEIFLGDRLYYKLRNIENYQHIECRHDGVFLRGMKVRTVDSMDYCRVFRTD